MPVNFLDGEWLTLSHDVKLPLVLIPEGFFRSGQDNTMIPLTAYYIGKYPITVEQYSCFLAAGAYDDPNYWSPAGWSWHEMYRVKAPGDSLLDESFRKPDHPQVGVSWHEAQSFCTWLSRLVGYTIALPNELQWEKAARGEDGRKYPWGATPPTDIHCNFDDGVGHTTAVGTYPAGRSPFACFDMAGNVWEWCRNTPGELPYKNTSEREDLNTRSLVTKRGGCWRSPRQDLVVWSRGTDFPLVRNSISGFRIVIEG